jgi:hypothetical protein
MMTLKDNILPDPIRPPTMEEIARAREMYANGFTVSRCLAAGHMSHGTFYYWLDGGPLLGPATDKSAAGGDERGERMLPPLPRRRVIVGKRRKPLAGSCASLVARLTRVAERQALDIEQRLSRPAAATPERERDVRMLAQLVQALRGLLAMAPQAQAPAAAAGAAEEEEIDIDAFRNALARRINSFVDEVRAREAQAAGEIEADQRGAMGKS